MFQFVFAHANEIMIRLATTVTVEERKVVFLCVELLIYCLLLQRVNYENDCIQKQK